MKSAWGIEHSISKGLPSTLKKPGALLTMKNLVAADPAKRKQFDFINLKASGQTAAKNHGNPVGQLLARTTRENKRAYRV